jgi:Gpi18-like mannosyltransferase
MRYLGRVLHSEQAVVWLLLLVALTPRLAVADGGDYAWDPGAFIDWSQALVHGSLHTFYPANPIVDYLPGYMWVLWGLGKIAPMVQHLPSCLAGWLLTYGSGGHPSRGILYKLPAIVADVVTVQVIYRVGKRWGDRRLAFVAALLYALSPGVLGNSARWGQVDSVPACLMLLGIVCCVDQRIILCALMLTLSGLMKPTVVVVVPLVIVTLLCRRNFKGVIQFGCTSLLTTALVYWPFVPAGSNLPQFIRFSIENTSGRYPVLSMHALNAWAALQAAMPRLTYTTADWATSVFGLSYNAWGWIMLVALVAIVCAVLAIHTLRNASLQPAVLLPAACVVVLGFFMLLTRIHERHMLPALPLLALSAILLPRLWIPYLWLSVVYLVNLQAIDASMIPWLPSLDIYSDWAKLVAGLNVLALCLTIVPLLYAPRVLARVKSSGSRGSPAGSLDG